MGRWRRVVDVRWMSSRYPLVVAKRAGHRGASRVKWRDRWRTRVERDTVVDVRVEKEVVQLPPERYVPKFYKWCTGLLLTILVLAIGRLALKRWL